jgi:hypothetical protein
VPTRFQLKFSPQEASDEEFVNRQFLKSAGLNSGTVVWVKKSLDSRGRIPFFLISGDVFSPGELSQKPEKLELKNVSSGSEVHIIGAGPAGLFAALQCIELGLKPIVLERGKAVKERRRDLAILNKELIVNEDSNYCFGEGGAGTYSDGKLYTRSKKRGSIDKVLNTFIEFGAEEKIRYEAHPHIGTNKLPGIIENIRNAIRDCGGEVRFNTKVVDMFMDSERVTHLVCEDVGGTGTDSGVNGLSSSKAGPKLGAIETDSGVNGIGSSSENLSVNNSPAHAYKMPVDKVILATGHSARDVFEWFEKHNLAVEAKPFALGVRIEHRQEIIDKIQYKCDLRGDFLPPSSYGLVEQVNGRGVFSFCMCPGGIIAPASTSPGEIVVNGWSPSKRNGKFANSGFVVAVDEDDFKGFNDFGALRAMKFQSHWEKRAFESTGSIVAPAQRVEDFIGGKLSSSLPECSYLPGVESVDLRSVLPKSVHTRIQGALVQIGRKMPLYRSNEAVLVGVESRTSSPVRIPRVDGVYHHPELLNLYPCGEGPGYAGGIMSAALDGMNIVMSWSESK